MDARSVVACLASKNPSCTEKRLLVGLALVREIIEKYNINLHHIAGEANPGDQYTKFEPNLVRDSVVDFSESTIGTDEIYVRKKKTGEHDDDSHARAGND